MASVSSRATSRPTKGAADRKTLTGNPRRPARQLGPLSVRCKAPHTSRSVLRQRDTQLTTKPPRPRRMRTPPQKRTKEWHASELTLHLLLQRLFARPRGAHPQDKPKDVTNLMATKISPSRPSGSKEAPKARAAKLQQGVTPPSVDSRPLSKVSSKAPSQATSCSKRSHHG